VVATGMDGASIAAIEPKVERRPLSAPPLRAETARAPAPAAEPVMRAPSYQAPAAPPAFAERPAAPPAPRYAEPASYAPAAAAVPTTPAPEPVQQAAFDDEPEEQGDLYAAPAPEPVRAAEPQITTRPITRIVDPSVEEHEEEPLFGETAFEDRRPQRGGFLSLFGSRPRYDAPAAQPAPAPRAAAPSRGGALPAEQPASDPQAESQEDLEIPSFLRRLAN
jgi:cell division protein FtsZ